MRSSHNLARVETTFDDDQVVPNGGLQAPAALAQKLGIAELIDQRVKLPADAAGRANVGVKAMTIIGAMLAGGDSIDDVAVLRAGAARKVFTATRAASTIGTWLRGFIWATVRMLDAVSRIVLARAWAAGLGPDLTADHTIDVDSTICQTYGTAKQGARFGYTKVRGYHPLLATLAATGEVLHARMEGVVVEHDVERELRTGCGSHAADDQPQLDGVVGAFERGVGGLGDIRAAVQPVRDRRPRVVGDRCDRPPDRRRQLDGHREPHTVVLAGGHERAGVERRVRPHRQRTGDPGVTHPPDGLADKRAGAAR